MLIIVASAKTPTAEVVADRETDLVVSLEESFTRSLSAQYVVKVNLKQA